MSSATPVSAGIDDRAPLLEVNDLTVHFPIKGGLFFQRQVAALKAVDGVSFSIHRGETLGLVGESGSGKTTVGKAIIQLLRPTSGSIDFNGQRISSLKGAALRTVRREMGIVFQDPYSAFNPRMTVGNIVGEPLTVHRLHKSSAEYIDMVADLMQTVGLSPSMMNRYPHEFSGGQRQRIGVARALAAKPSLVILDEPVSALDVSIQAQVINLLMDLQEKLNLAYLFIAHDLSVVRHISDRVAVMYLGKIAEIADRDQVYENPMHPYTQALLSAVPSPSPALERRRRRTVLKGDLPSPLNPPSGCVFHTRCPIAIEECRAIVPELVEHDAGQKVACIRAGYAD